MNIAPVSVIIVTRNQAATLPASIDSALNQTLAPLDVIVVDDGSTDATQQVLAGYGGRITVLRNGEAMGPAWSRNAAIDAARGEWLALLEPGDCFTPDKLARQLSLTQQRGAAFSCADYWQVDDGARKLFRMRRPLPADPARALAFGNIAHTSTVLVRREALELSGAFDDRLYFAHDWECWIRLMAAGCPMTHIAEPLLLAGAHAPPEADAAERILAESMMLLDAYTHMVRRGSVDSALVQEAQATHLWDAALAHAQLQDWGAMNTLLNNALALRPDWRREPGVLLSRLESLALSMQVPDPAALAAAVLAHLPAGLLPARARCARIVAANHLFRGLLNAALGDGPDDASGRASLTSARHLCEQLFNPKAKVLSGLIHAFVSDFALAPALLRIDHIMRSLPMRPHAVRRLRRSVEADLFLRFVYRDGFHDAQINLSQAAALLTQAVRRRPRLLANPATLSILGRSFLARPGPRPVTRRVQQPGR